jgi:hypothetical protein
VRNSVPFQILIGTAYLALAALLAILVIGPLVLDHPDSLPRTVAVVLATVVATVLVAVVGWVAVRHLRRGASWDATTLHVRGLWRDRRVGWADVVSVSAGETVIQADTSAAGLAAYAATGRPAQSWSFARCAIGLRSGLLTQRMTVSSSYRSSTRAMLEVVAALPADHPLRAALAEPYRSATAVTIPDADPAAVRSAPVVETLRMPGYLPVIYTIFDVVGVLLMALLMWIASRDWTDQGQVDVVPTVLFGVAAALALLFCWMAVRIWSLRIELTGAGMRRRRMFGRAEALPGPWILGFVAVQIDQGSNLMMHTAAGVSRNLVVGAGLGDRAHAMAEHLNQWLTGISHPPQLLTEVRAGDPAPE